MRELRDTGDIFVADGGRERVRVIDCKTSKIARQYGVTYRKGIQPG